MRTEHHYPKLPLHKLLLFSLVPLLAAALLAEAVFWLFSGHGNTGKSIAGTVEPDPVLVWRLKPRTTGPLRTNELGFRDKPLNLKAAVKILLLGDSVSWGDGIDNVEDVYPQLTEELLSSLSTGKVFEIINSAVPGYSTFQELRYLEIRGLALDPDMIVLQFCLNDVVERYWNLAQYGGDNVFFGIDTRHSIPGVFGWMIRHSRTFELLARQLVDMSRNKQEYEVRNMAKDYLSHELEDAWILTLSEIDRIRDIAAVNNIPFLLIIAPYEFQLDDPTNTSQPQQRLLSYFNRHGVQVVDLLPCFSSFHLQNSDVELFNDASHFSTAGHKIAAEVIARSLSGILSSQEEP